MSDEPLAFTVRVDHNPYLAMGQQNLHVVVQVAATEGSGTTEGGTTEGRAAEGVAIAGGAAEAGAAEAGDAAAEVIIIDTSKSMTGSRIAEARKAASAAVDVIRDGTYFAVISGHTSAELVYPAGVTMVAATARNRSAAKRKIAKVEAGGVTNMSTWLRLADTLLASCPARIKHAIMLTDGHSTDSEGALRVALKSCEGHFVCDCRGVGDGWRDDELRQIARALLGTWAPVAAPEQLADDFRAALTASMSKRIPGVLLRIRPTSQTRIGHFSQVMPVIEDLTGKGVVVDDGQATEYPLGHWGAQIRDYHLRLETSQRDLRIEPGARVRTARLEVVLPPAGAASGAGEAGARVAASASVGVVWTHDIMLSGSINPRVAGYTGQEELAAAVSAGLDAWRNGRPDAEEKIGEAVRLAHLVQHTDLLERFSAIAELIDPAAGVIRLRGYEQVSRADVLWASYLSEQSRYVDRDE